MYSYEEAFKDTSVYFNGDDLATKIFVEKYALKDNNGNLLEKTPTDMHWRLAKEFYRIEKIKYKSDIEIDDKKNIDFKKPLSLNLIFSMFDKFKRLVPQGGPSFTIGNKYQICSTANCFVLNSPLDSYNSILETDKELVNIVKRRGGCGLDLSKLRPKGARTQNAAFTSTGIVSWASRYSNSTLEVGQGNRRGALMITLSVHHPDIFDFITMKNDELKVTGANISVRLSKEFLDAVEKNSEYELRFPVDSKTPTISKFVKAKDVWDLIIKSAHNRAEPGLLFWDNILKGPADYYPKYRSISTNPCAEHPLAEGDACRIMAQNLTTYVKNQFLSDSYFDYDELYYDVIVSLRLMDDLVDLENEQIIKILQKIEKDPEPWDIKQKEYDMWLNIQDKNNNGRRCGLGTTGLGDTLAMLNIKYGSENSIDVVDNIFRTIKFAAYRSSIEMAKELGHFTEWDSEKEKDCDFINRFKNEKINIDNSTIDGTKIYNDMKRYGRRNIGLLTCAPTGTISCLTQTTSGVEPVFMLSYTRRKKITDNVENYMKVDFVDKLGIKWQEFTVYHHNLNKWRQIYPNKDINESPYYLATAGDINWVNRVKMQSVMQSHICAAISATCNLPENISVEEVSNIYNAAWKHGLKGFSVYRQNCRSGVLVEKKEESIKSNNRPKSVDCDIHNISVKGEKFTVVIGIMDNKPYEIFAFSSDGKIGHQHDKGSIKRIKKGHYQLLDNEQAVLVESLTGVCTPEQEALNRLASTALRHGTEVQFIVEQLDKSGGDITNYGRGVARVLKRYIIDGTKIDDEKCPECSGELIRESGCTVCKICGWSKC